MMEVEEPILNMIKAYILYTGADGHSHFKEGFVTNDLITDVRHLHFKETAANASYDWHTAPRTQYVITLKGSLEFTTSLGKTFILQTGEVLIATDTTGKGHKWKLIGTDPWLRAYVAFEENEPINFQEHL
ncbi:hypothetical protein KXS00_04780 [Olivibacter jilunii]